MTHNHNTTAITVCIFVCLSACYMVTYSGNLYTIDDAARIAVTESICQRGQVDINQIAWSQWALSPVTRQGSFGPQGDAFAKKGIGSSLLAVPLCWAALAGPDVGLVQAMMLINPLLTAATACVVFLYVRRLGYSVGTGLAATFTFGLGTIAWVYTKFFMDEPLTSLTLFLAAYVLLRWRHRATWRGLFLAGCLLSLAVATKTTNLALVPLYVLYMVLSSAGTDIEVWPRRTMTRDALVLITPVALACGVLGLYNWVRFGSLLSTGYQLGAGESFTTPLWLGLYGLLLSPYKSVFLYSPILVVCAVSFPEFAKHHRLEGWLFGLISLVSLVMFAMWYMWWGGFAWGPRFLVPLMPFWATALAPLLASVGKKASRALKVAISILLLLSCAVQVIGASVNFVSYEVWLRQIFPAPELDPGQVDVPALYDLYYSPILGHIRLLSPSSLDFAWLKTGPVDFYALGATLGLALLSLATLLLLIHRARAPLSTPKVALLIVVGLTLVTMLCGFCLDRYSDEPADGSANAGLAESLRQVEIQGKPGDAVITITPYQYDFVMNRYRGRLPILGLARVAAPLNGEVTRLLEKSAASHPRLWLLAAGIQPGDPSNGVEQWLVEHAFKATDTWYGDSRLCLFGSQKVVAEPVAVNVRLGPAIALLDYQVSRTVSPGEFLGLQLSWEALRPPDRDYKVFVHLLDQAGQVVAQRDSQPSDGFHPTSTWKPGEMLSDRYGLLLLDSLEPGTYELVVGMYDGVSGQRLLPSAGGSRTGLDVIPLADMHVEGIQ